MAAVTVGFTNTKSFIDRIKKRTLDINRRHRDILRSTALDILILLRDTTPKDTHWATENWQIGVNSEPTSTIGSYPGKGGHFTEQTLARAFSLLRTVRSGDVVYFVNNVPYISSLNDGWSSQAPARFVESAINHGERLLTARGKEG